LSKPSKDILQLPLEKRAEIALKIAVAKAIDEHFRLGFPVYIWRKGKVVKLSAKEVRNSSRSKKSKKCLLGKIDRYGRVTIPAEFRRKLSFTPGTKVLIQLRRGGFVVRRVDGGR
jgi:AbrB family looped-hinge helix DNA binding protein